MEVCSVNTASKEDVTLKAEDWKYLAEGNQHIILKYEGKDEKFFCKILKLEKKLVKVASERAKDSFSLEEESLDFLKQFMDENALQKLIVTHIHHGIDTLKKFIPKEEEFNAKNRAEFIQNVGKLIELDRPESRRAKEIDPDSKLVMCFDYSKTFVELFSDLVCKDDLTVFMEIKPKSHLFDKYELDEVIVALQDYHAKLSNTTIAPNKPPPSFDFEKIYSEHFDFKRIEGMTENEHGEYQIKYTKFYKVQLKKNDKSEKKEYSLYKPVTFYGNDRTLLKQSISSLIKTPQNNLKFLVNGFDVLKKTQQQQHHDLNTMLDSSSSLVGEYSDIIANIIHESHIVKTLKHIQGVYDGNVQQVAKTLKESQGLLKEMLASSTSENVKVFLQKELLKIINKIGDKKCEDPYVSLNEIEAKISKNIELLIRFLLSITFRDCSMLLSLHKIQRKLAETPLIQRFLEANGFSSYKADAKADEIIFYKLGLVDTDLKPLKHLITYPKLDKELLDIYVEHIMTTDQLSNKEKVI
jgi:hypothetical protein